MSDPKTIYADPTVNYDSHRGRVDFERIRESGNLDNLMNYIEAFIRRGHNPHDPRDEMYAIMGITPDYLDFMKHDFEEKKNRKLQDTDVFFNNASQAPAQSKGKTGHGKSKKQVLGFGPEDE